MCAALAADVLAVWRARALLWVLVRREGGAGEGGTGGGVGRGGGGEEKCGAGGGAGLAVLAPAPDGRGLLPGVRRGVCDAPGCGCASTCGGHFPDRRRVALHGFLSFRLPAHT